MNRSRREFLAGTAWMGAAAMAAGCMSRKSPLCGIGNGAGAPMHGFAVPPMENVRVGVIGVGGRGIAAVKRIVQIPGCAVTAISDINPERLDLTQAALKGLGKPAAKEWSRNGDEDAWKGLCDSDVCDVVYSVTPRKLHCSINVYAMDHGKHVLQEVPGAFDIEECWATVEAAERNRRHCMMLENCTYGEAEMLAFNLIHKGKLGEVVQAEVGYTHDQRSLQYKPRDGRFWRIDRHLHQHGNYYPTHGLVPAGRCLNINRGDRFEQLVSFETKSVSFEEFGRANFPESDWRHSAKMVRGDVNMSMLRTANGKILTLKHNVATPNPYDRGNMYLGSKGIFRGIDFVENAEDAYTGRSPCRFGWEESVGGKVEAYFPLEKAQAIRKEFRHPFWKAFWEPACKIGGHGGMDPIMDLRWAYCLQKGLPLDTDVYDLATYSSIVELTERSVNAGGRTVEFPDYTRGGWKTAKPFADDEIDTGHFKFDALVASGRGSGGDVVREG